METVIKKLSEIEAAASRLIDSANEEKRLLDQESQKTIEEYDRMLELKTKEQLMQIQKDLELQLNQELESLRSRTDRFIADLEQYYTVNHKKLATEICQDLLRT